PQNPETLFDPRFRNQPDRRCIDPAIPDRSERSTMGEALAQFDAVDVVDDVVVRRLLTLRDQVAKPGEDVLGELLQLFERDSRVRLLALKDALAARDSGARKSAAHALKGSAGNVGARRVAAIAAHI